MIILRYLSRELLQTTFAVTIVLMVVIMTGRFVKYLAEAAAGKFDPAVLLSIMFYRVPGFMELILPLGFMVAILMAYGRLYAEQEMTVLSACGISQRQILTYTYLPALLIALLVGICSIWLTPMGLQKATEIIEQQKQRNELDTLRPGKFQVSRSGKLVSYSEAQGDKNQLDDVFIATIGITEDEAAVTVKAESATRITHPDFQTRYLLFLDGVRHQGRPGSSDYRITQFEGFAQQIDTTEFVPLSTKKINLLSTRELFSINSAEAEATLQWRLSAPLLIIILTLLGITLSYTTPRRGRYVMLFPCILIYLIYLVLLNAARGAIEENNLSPQLGLWVIHGMFLGAGILLFLVRTGQLSTLLKR